MRRVPFSCVKEFDCWGVVELVRRLTLDQEAAGSSPASPAIVCPGTARRTGVIFSSHETTFPPVFKPASLLTFPPRK